MTKIDDLTRKKLKIQHDAELNVQKIDKEIEKALIDSIPVPIPPKNIYDSKYNNQNVRYQDLRQPDTFIKKAGQMWNMASKGHRSIMINMELANGDHTHFVAFPEDGQFKYDNRTYITDDSLKYYDIASKIYCLDYHYDITLPIKRNIPASTIRKTISLPGVTDVDHAINPSTLKLFVESQVIQKVIKGADLDKVMDFIKMMLIFILIVSVVTMIIIIKSSGMMDNLNMPKLW